MPTNVPPNYRVAAAGTSDYCDRCFHRADDGTKCGKWPDYDGYQPNGVCEVFAPRSMGQRFEEEPAVTPNADATTSANADPVVPPAVDPPRVEEHADLTTFATISNVQIFRAGTWNGTKYTAADIDGMVKAAAEVGYRPPVKLGHTQEPSAPAYGYVVNLRRDGDVLVGDFEDVPDELVSQIREKRYDAVSSEIYFDLARDKKKFKHALRAVAVLGAHPPAVASLKPLSEALAGLSETTQFATIDLDHPRAPRSTGAACHDQPGRHDHDPAGRQPAGGRSNRDRAPAAGSGHGLRGCGDGPGRGGGGQHLAADHPAAAGGEPGDAGRLGDDP